MSESLDATVAQLRKAATTAVRTGKVDASPSHPNADLLVLCALILDLRAKYDAIDREARTMPSPYVGNPAFDAELAKRNAVKRACMSPMARVGKIAANTPAGVYAKAMVLRASYGTAPQLALSIARDLVNCPGLRSALWPAGEAV
jgi:hypothetical protein